MKSISRIIFILFCCFSISATCVALPKTNVLFVLFDAGETNALKIIFQDLEKKQISYQIFSMGTSHHLLAGDPHAVDIKQSCAVAANIDTKWPHHKKLPQENINKIVGCLDPKIVITGMVSNIQKQIAEGFRKRGVYIIGYYDGFAPPGPKDIPSDFLNIANTIFVPTNSIAAPLNKQSSTATIEVVGQPTLEQWKESFKTIDKKYVRQKLQLNPKHKTILYAGGYGSGYEKAFKLFVQAAFQLKDFQFRIALHPKVDGSLEQKILDKNHADFIRIDPKEISTLEAATVADVVVTWRSTVGVQAFFAEKQVVYLDPEPDDYKNIAITNGWSPQTDNVSQFTKLVSGILVSNKKVDSSEISKSLPLNSSRKIADRLDCLLKSISR